MARLSYHFGDTAWRVEAREALEAYGQMLSQEPRAFTTSLMVLEMLTRGPVELAFLGAPGDGRRALERAASEVFVPHLVIGYHDPAEGDIDLPLLAGKATVQDAPALYVCRDYACQRPVTRAEDVAAALAAPA